jgi:signal transduction histidine kinase/CheY-like chemotaxis protein
MESKSVSPRAQRRWITWLLLGAVLGVAAFSAVAINMLGNRADDCRQMGTAMARVQAEANQLNAREWEAIHRGKIDAEGNESVAKSQAHMQEQLDLLRSLNFGLPQLDEVVEEYNIYRESVGREFDFLKAGDIKEAEDYDEAHVDPSFEKLSETLSEAAQAVNKLAIRTLSRVHQLTFVVLVAAAGALGLLFWQYNQKRRADEVVAAEKRGLQEANVQLEARVLERTAEIAQANAALQQENAERKQAELAMQEAKNEADKANLAKSEFLSRMSHELRTPLNAILGFSQLLQQADLAPGDQESVRYIYRGGRHLLELINEVLDLARIEAGHMQVSIEPVSTAEALNEACDLVRPIATERKIEVKKPPVSEREWIVMADRQRLKQVILNLLGNALKYNRDNGEVTVSYEEMPSARLRISITDTGPGITPEKRRRLFIPFDRLGAEDSSVEGTGLGLALSKRLTEAMGGTIGCESEFGRGSTFWIEFPLAVNMGIVEATNGHDAPPPRAVADKRAHLLYIEDNASNLTLVEHFLRKQPKFKLTTAMQGTVGVELAIRHRPDLILLDLHLPDINGAEVLARLKSDDRTRSIPVIMLSADAIQRRIKESISNGAAAYLTKPLDVNQFFQVIEEHLPVESVPA